MRMPAQLTSTPKVWGWFHSYVLCSALLVRSLLMGVSMAEEATGTVYDADGAAAHVPLLLAAGSRTGIIKRSQVFDNNISTIQISPDCVLRFAEAVLWDSHRVVIGSAPKWLPRSTCRKFDTR